MTTLDYICLAVSFAALVAAAALVLISRRRSRKLIENLYSMLNAAMDGSFSEACFDESLFSAVEAKLAHYLSACESSAKNLAFEKDKIKELIADISHQTKTPLANILLYAQLLGEKNLPDDCSDCLYALSSQAEKLSFLIGSLVKTSRLETGVVALCPAATKLNPMLLRVIGQLAPRARAKSITVSYTETAHTACFDEKWTAEALFNILDNAVKYTPEGGAIALRVTPYQLFCRIDISDNGIGISEDEQSKVFSRFYRSACVSQTEGVGLGLFLAREIVGGQGGYIKLRSQKDKGTVFSVFLPTEQER